MSDSNDENGAKNGAKEGRAPLTLKPRAAGSVSTGTVKQSFSHGRSKTVVVETKRRAPGGGAPVPGEKRPAVDLKPRAKAEEAPARSPEKPKAQPQAAQSQGGLSAGEMEARRKVLEAAKAEQDRRDAETRSRAPAPARTDEAPARSAPARTEAAQPSVSQAAASVSSEPVRASAPTQTVRASAAQSVSTQQAQPSSFRMSAPGSARMERAPRAEERPASSSFSQRAPRDGDQPRGERPERGERGDRGPRPEGDRGPRGPRPDGERGERRFDGPRGPRPEGDRGPRGPRPDGERGERRFDGPRGPRPEGDRGPRGPRPDGERRFDGPRGPRPDGDRGPRGPRPEGSNMRMDRGPRPGGEGGGSMRMDRGPRPGGSARMGTGTPPPALLEAGKPRPAPKGDLRRTGDDDDRKTGKAAAPGKAVSRTKGEPKRREGRLTLQHVVGDGDEAADRMRSLASVRRAREREKEKRKGSQQEVARVAREVVIPDVITVQELSNRMAVRAVDIIKFLMKQGMMMKINDVLDTDIAELVATEFGHTVKRVSESDVEDGFIGVEDHDDHTEHRAPVVAVMGHVDHGKTSLLDALRQTDVAAGEAGGITQHIGAYQVRLPAGQRVTFLDTPGHAAFSAMRARGANVTDIVILVVAGDDGVMPQTIEAINHAKAAGAPIIVAVNKMDKPGSNATRVINELLQHEVVVESLGGDTQIIEVSALKRTGLDNLIEAVLMQAEIMELRANPDRVADGVVIESKLDKGRGPVATVLVKRGTLKRGDIVVAGAHWGKVRAVVNERGEQLPEAGPSMPVEILGLDGSPEPGEPFAVVENEARAREITEYRERQRREKTVAPAMAGVSLSDLMSKLKDQKVKELPIVLKADVQGSAEAIIGSLEKISNDEVRARIIHSGAGAINESDVLLAKTARAPIIGFNVRASKQARELAEREGVEIRYYAIIYDLLDDLKGVLSGMLAPIQRETFLGNAEVLEVFDITKIGKVGGCRVTEGVVRKGAKVRILRDNVVIQEMGTLQTLKRFKDEVNEVVVGQECGMSFAAFQDIKKGDLVECFTIEEIKRSL